MAASRSTPITRSTVGLNGSDETFFCGRTLRNHSIAPSEEGSPHCQVPARSPKKRPELQQTLKGNSGGRNTDRGCQALENSWSARGKEGSNPLKGTMPSGSPWMAVREGRPAQAASPILKRLKRCLRFEAPRKRSHSVVDSGADAQGAKRACRCLLLDDCEKREIKKANFSGEGCPDAAIAPEAAAEEASEEESIPISHPEFPEYKELLELKKLKKQKLQQQAESGFVEHSGFKCDNCGMEPIQGIRWHCQDCPQDVSLDFCDSCSDCLHETDLHKEDHRLEPVYRAGTFLDRDYCLSQGASYSYLDPNYFPANR
uniref:ZZ-type domain-containing protein n=1 Tax=Monodelphis domestica TaxID=13616 RepID=A0A5F8GRS5_MONDO